MSERVIKFRQPIFKVDGTFDRFHYWGFVENDFIGPLVATPNRELVGKSGQFTGEFDKNGKEIYEGDRCRQRRDKWSEVGVVTFTNGTYYLTFQNRQIELYIAIDNDEVEIISTVHDTQEAK